LIAKVSDCLGRTNLGATAAEFDAFIRLDNHRVGYSGLIDFVRTKIHAVVAIDTQVFVNDWIPVFSHKNLLRVLRKSGVF